MSRSKTYEAQALSAIGNAAKADGRTTELYANEVRKRLDQGAEEYGGEKDDGWWRRGLERCIAEASEEGVDLSGWVLGCLQVLRDEVLSGRIERDQAHTAQYLLLESAAAGLKAWVSAQMAADVIRDARGDRKSVPAPDRFTRPFSDPGD